MNAFIYKNENGQIWHRSHTENKAYGVSETSEVKTIEPPKAKFEVLTVDGEVVRRPKTAKAAKDFAESASCYKKHGQCYAVATLGEKRSVIKSCPGLPKEGTVLDVTIFEIAGVKCLRTSTHYEPCETRNSEGALASFYTSYYCESI